MSIKPLTIVNGIIQDREINGIPIKINIVEPDGKRNVRTLIPLGEWWGVTQHSTGNIQATASDEAHSKWMQNVENADRLYVSAHIFIDEDSISQVLPLNEEGYHAGDGKNGPGNTHTIAVENCENGNLEKTERNAKIFIASLLIAKGGIVYKHQDWNGKYCPRTILRDGRWEAYVNEINEFMSNSTLHEWKKEGFDWFIENGLMNNPEIWIKKINGTMETYAVLIFIKRAIENLTIKLRKSLKD